MLHPVVSCLHSRDNPLDQQRCDPRCPSGQTCYNGQCSPFDARITEGKTSDLSATDAPADGSVDGFTDGDGALADILQQVDAPGDGPVPDMLAPDLLPPDTFDPCPHVSVVKSCTGTSCLVPSGCFRMGSPASEPCRAVQETRHHVFLTHTFRISPHEVTQQEFADLMQYLPFVLTACPTCPVENLSWHEAAAYCNALSIAEGFTPCYDCAGALASVTCQSATAYAAASIYSCPGYRLPTEAEWEYAYRAGTSSAFYNGEALSCAGSDTNADTIGWYLDNAASTSHAVGNKLYNSWGLADMAGNVWEWCHDRYQDDLGANDITDPWGAPSGSERVCRGGSWSSPAGSLRAAARQHHGEAYHDNEIGFRCVRTSP